MSHGQKKLSVPSHHTSDEWYRATFEQAADGIFIINSEGRHIEVNQRGCDMLGYTREELLHRSFSDLIPPEDLANDPLRLDDLDRSQTILRERHLLCRDGRLLPVEISASKLTDGNFLGFIRDITQRKQTEIEIKKLAKFPNENPNPVMRVAHDGVVLYANQASAGLLENWGCTEGQCLPDTWYRLILESLRTGQAQEEETAVGEHVFSLFFAPLVEFGYVNVYGYDITKRKRVLKALSQSEAQYRGLFEHMLEGFAYCQMIFEDGEPQDFIYIAVNDMFETLTGLKDVVGKRVTEVIPDIRKTDPELFDIYARVSLTGEPEKFEIFLKALGMWFSVSVYSPEKEFFVAVFDVITERKQAEIALQTSEARLNGIIESAMDAIISVDEAQRIVLFNAAAEKMFGCPADQVLGQSLDRFIPERSRSVHRKAIRAFGQADSTKQAMGNLGIISALRANGEEFLVEATISQVEVAGAKLFTVIHRDITQRKQAEAELLLARFTIDHVADAVYWIDPHAQIVDVNQTACHMLGYAYSELIGLTLSDIDPNFSLAGWSDIWLRLKELGTIRLETEHRSKDGQIIPVEILANFIEYEGRELDCAVVRDITGRKQAEEAQSMLEEQLRQAQKMESIGRLAGGVAHDFNNQLTVIQMYTDLIRLRMLADDPLQEKLDQIRQASQRAANLTGQLLAFSRKQMLNPSVINLNDLVTNLQKMLERLIGEDIILATALQPGLWPVTADPGQIEQVIMNLVVNARDAMPTGGLLTITTENIVLDENYARQHLETPIGSCILLTVADTGHGMDRATQEQIFEPFFTTKNPGEGTGLGLATAHGTIKQSGGNILVYSEPGQGTTFKIYLPASQTGVEVQAVPPTQSDAWYGRETILVTEDETAVRELITITLQELGYTILEAHDGEEALSLARQHPGQIDLLLTDVVMPKMSGRDLAETLQTQRPSLKTLFMSGYMDDAVVRHGLLRAEVAFLAKPFSSRTLAAKVRKVLDK